MREYYVVLCYVSSKMIKADVQYFIFAIYDGLNFKIIIRLNFITFAVEKFYVDLCQTQPTALCSPCYNCRKNVTQRLYSCNLDCLMDHQYCSVTSNTETSRPWVTSCR